MSAFMRECEYPDEAVTAVLNAYDFLIQNAKFASLLSAYYDDETINVDPEGGILYQIAVKENINFYTAKLVTYVCLSQKLKENYLNAGLSEDFWIENITDLKYKMMECFNVNHVWGIFSPSWFNGVFRMKTFTIGRLCYNTSVYDGEEFTILGHKVKKGDKIINIHIPSSGKPFDKSARVSSYRRAYEFFKTPVFRCETWLLYPPNREILDPDSNIISFMDDFEIVDSYEYDDNSIMWRVFGDKYKLPVKDLPKNSSLRRTYADFLANGNKPGAGIGYFTYKSIKE